MNDTAARMCGDRMKTVLNPESMGISLQRGVYLSFFGNKCLWKDLGQVCTVDSSRISAHRKVWDEFKKKKSDHCRHGVAYGEV